MNENESASPEENKAQANDALLHEAKLQLRDGALSAAVATLNNLLSDAPEHRDGLYYLAVCQRQSKDHAAAQQVLQSLLSTHPQYGRAYQEQGQNFNALNQSEQAGQAFQKAVALNPSLIASWKALVIYHDGLGDMVSAQEAMRHVKWLSHLPPQLVTVSSLIHEDKLYIAERICREFLQQQPHHIEAMRLLAEIGSKLQILDEAEFLLESCVEFSPDYKHARMDYVQVLHKRQKFQKALEQAKHLHASEPDNVAFEVSLASETQAVGDFTSALAIYDNIIERNPQLHAAHSARGHALKTIGRSDEAIKSYRQAYLCKADFGDAYWSLANLKTYVFTDVELAQMREQEQHAETQTNDRVHLCFALGKALEDRKEYAESFSYYQQGNSLKQLQSQYNAARMAAEFREQQELFDADFFEQRLGWGHSSAAPIFVVGLPRAGSTLLEQILASHSAVDGTMELANIIGLAHRLRGKQATSKNSRYPSILGEFGDDQLQKFGESFIEDTLFHRQGGAYFIDKMPNNFRHIALIQLILPNAKIIDARRHPMACCFSGFKQLFAEGQEFSYGLESIGAYYRGYVDLMAHWDAVLPGKILRVQHEDVVDDLETQVRRILDYCELPFEQQCIDFHETERAVRTPSSEQVRQPIYQTGTEQWQHYEQHLDPRQQALGPALQSYR